jgi:hypothetical protein
MRQCQFVFELIHCLPLFDGCALIARVASPSFYFVNSISDCFNVVQCTHQNGLIDLDLVYAPLDAESAGPIVVEIFGGDLGSLGKTLDP